MSSLAFLGVSNAMGNVTREDQTLLDEKENYHTNFNHLIQ